MEDVYLTVSKLFLLFGLFAAKLSFLFFFFSYFAQPQCLLPVISASLASEVEERPTYFAVTSFHLGHDSLPSCHNT